MRAFRRSTKSLGGSNEAKHHISIPQKDATAIVPPKKVIKAKFDWTPEDGDPRFLGFSQGDFLHVVGRENDPHWYEACNPIVNTRGLVPVDYFELVSKQVRNSGDRSMPGEGSGYQMNLVDRTVGGGRSGSVQISAPTSPPDSRMSATGRTSAATVYGIVLYEFKAERPDELQATAGEAILVIAQSNPDWFVAKPITRLGGPGLIPVSYVEIRDTATQLPVKDTQAAIRSAGVPRVEEWKRMAASYKNSSIPLGRLGGTSQQSEDNGIGEGRRPSQQYGGGTPQRWSGQRASGLPLHASVPRFAHRDKKFWFVVEAYLDDGRYWELSREYTDFYALQTALMDSFPEASGKVPGQRRLIPFMPGPLPWVTERLTSERREHMDKYMRELLQLGSGGSELGRRIMASRPLRDFFVPREGDREVDGFEETDPGYARLSQGSSQHAYHQHDSRQSSTGDLNGGANGSSSGWASPPGGQHYRSPSNDMRSPPPSQYAPQSSYMPLGNGTGTGGSNKEIVKIYMPTAKDKNNVVSLRLDNGYNFRQLMDGARKRWVLAHQGDERTEAELKAEAKYLVMTYKDPQGNYRHLDSDGDLMKAHSEFSKANAELSKANAESGRANDKLLKLTFGAALPEGYNENQEY